MVRPPLAKVADVWGRVNAYCLCVLLYVIGYISKSCLALRIRLVTDHQSFRHLQVSVGTYSVNSRLQTLVHGLQLIERGLRRWKLDLHLGRYLCHAAPGKTDIRV